MTSPLSGSDAAPRTSPAHGTRTADGPHTDEPRARFRDVVAAEWIKHRSLRSTPLAYGVTALAVVGFNAGTAHDLVSHWTERDAAGRASFVREGVPLQQAFTGNAALILMIALGAIGALVIVGEYGTGTIRTTFAAVPARHAVMGAKVVVVTVVTSLFGVCVAGLSFAATQTILDGRGLGVPLSHPGAARVILASALLAPVCALTGMALGAVIRHTSATMIASFVVLQVLPLVLSDGRYWSAVAGHALPYRAWLRLTTSDHRAPVDFPWTTGGAWTVLAVWTLVPALVTVVCVRRRDQ